MAKSIIIKKGDKYGRLTIVKEVERKNEKRRFLCKCDCGNEIIVALGNLRSGNTTSCGCKKKENREFSEKHKRRISESSKGKKMSLQSRYKNMQNNLNYNLTLEWLMSFEDIDKLRFLNRLITTCRQEVLYEDYIKFIEFYYYDKRFNEMYNYWIKNGKEKYLKPSLDHIIPISQGGKSCFDNFQILTWFENRCKNDMTQEEWDKIKNNIWRYFR